MAPKKGKAYLFFHDGLSGGKRFAMKPQVMLFPAAVVSPNLKKTHRIARKREHFPQRFLADFWGIFGWGVGLVDQSLGGGSV